MGRNVKKEKHQQLIVAGRFLRKRWFELLQAVVLVHEILRWFGLV